MCLKFFVLAALVAVGSAKIQERFITQRLNHFDPAERRTWDMRYFANADYYFPGGPIFIYVGAGYEVYDNYLQTGLVHDLAKEIGGYIFATESRYYGQSRPTNDTSLVNLQYMSIEQNVADLAYFIEYIQGLYLNLQNARVILFGKSTGASIAVWTRQKYPYLVDGVLASSASLLTDINNVAYLENVGETVTNVGSQRCYDRIENAFESMARSIDNGDVARIRQLFRLCTDIDTTNDLDIGMFKLSITSNIGVFIENATPTEVEGMCQSITNETIVDDVEALANWVANDFLGVLDCLNFSFETITTLFSDSAWDTTATIFGGRQNYYRYCVQVPNFPSTLSANQPFGSFLTFELFLESCKIVFGDLFTMDLITENTERMNTEFGGLNPAVRNVFFTNGAIDPLRTLGVLEDLNQYSPAAVVPLTSRSRDLSSVSPTDTQAMRDVKMRSRELIIQWILEDNETEVTYAYA